MPILNIFVILFMIKEDNKYILRFLSFLLLINYSSLLFFLKLEFIGFLIASLLTIITIFIFKKDRIIEILGLVMNYKR